MIPVNSTTLRQVPKVVLHDHLDGGLRPSTLIELAHSQGYRGLPTDDPEQLAHWFHTHSRRGSLQDYLDVFTHTVAVMQTQESLYRVAYECVEDLAADSIVYAEIRFAPELHTRQGLDLDHVIHAVLAGLSDGERHIRLTGKTIHIRCLLTAMRHSQHSLDIAKRVIQYHDQGVAGFDLAGLERGYPPTQHHHACEYIRQHQGLCTIHAGEDSGLESIYGAVDTCGANRIGHGIRIIDDIYFVDGQPQLGQLAVTLRDKCIPLEICPSSNLQTGAISSMDQHPFALLAQQHFCVTINTDNRLISNTTMTQEMLLLASEFGYSWKELMNFTINAMKSAFLDITQKRIFIEKIIQPEYMKLIN